MRNSHNSGPKLNSGCFLCIKMFDGNVEILGEFVYLTFMNIVNIKLLPLIICLSNKRVGVKYMASYFLWQNIVIWHFLPPLSFPTPPSFFCSIFKKGLGNYVFGLIILKMFHLTFLKMYLKNRIFSLGITYNIWVKKDRRGIKSPFCFLNQE